MQAVSKVCLDPEDTLPFAPRAFCRLRRAQRARAPPRSAEPSLSLHLQVCIGGKSYFPPFYGLVFTTFLCDYGSFLCFWGDFASVTRFPEVGTVVWHLPVVDGRLVVSHTRSSSSRWISSLQVKGQHGPYFCRGTRRSSSSSSRFDALVAVDISGTSAVASPLLSLCRACRLYIVRVSL